MPDYPKVFVCTLYSGESEIGDCKCSVERQTYPEITHEVISFLPNREAHEALYSRFMALAGEYAYFIKLDADMCFAAEDVVSRLVGYMVDHPGLDHLSLTVNDFYTSSSVFGVHCFSSRCTWNLQSESLFVDPFPAIPGDRLLFRTDNPRQNLVKHAFGQSLHDAYAFGYHKAVKLLQPGGGRIDFAQLQNHWANIRHLGSVYRKIPEEIRRMALQGAFDCLLMHRRGQATVEHNHYKEIPVPPVANGLAFRFFLASAGFQWLSIALALGPVRCARYFAHRLKAAMFSPTVSSSGPLIGSMPEQLMLGR